MPVLLSKLEPVSSRTSTPSLASGLLARVTSNGRQIVFHAPVLVERAAAESHRVRDTVACSRLDGRRVVGVVVEGEVCGLNHPHVLFVAGAARGQVVPGSVVAAILDNVVSGCAGYRTIDAPFDRAISPVVSAESAVSVVPSLMK